MQKFFLILMFKLCIALCFIVCSINTGYSENLSDTIHIKQIVIRADRKTNDNARGTTSRIDSLAMANASTSSLSDLIAKNTPIFIKEYGRGAMATVSFRGTAPSHTNVTWNGISLNSPMLGMVDFSTIPVYFIDDVTLLHGPGSIIEKSGALGGIVKLQNYPDWQNRFSGRVLTGIGSYGTKDEFVKLDFGNKNFQSQTRVFYNYSDNDYPIVNKFNADIDPVTGEYIYAKTRNENASYQNYGVLQELYLKPAEKSILTLRYWYQHNDRSLPRLLTNESGMNVNRQEQNFHRASFEWKKYGNKGIFSITSGLNTEFLNYWLKTKIFGAEDHFAVDSKSNSVSWYNKIHYTYQLKENISVSTGMEADLHNVNSENTSSTSDSSGYDKSRTESNLFLQLSKKFGHKVTATILGRQNFINEHPIQFIPSIGLEFQNLGFFIKTNLTKNYHQPSLNELYYTPGGNADLKPEEGLMADIGTGYMGARFNISLNGYVSRIENWIIWLPNPQGYWVPFNMKLVQASGIELHTGFNGNLFKILKYRFNSNYAYTRSINKDDPHSWADESIGKQLPYIPVHSANILSNISCYGYFINWIWNYYSERFTTTSTDKESSFDVIYPYIMNNISLGKEIKMNNNKRINVEIKIMNLLNEDYRTVLQHPMPGRNYSLLLRYDF